MPITTLYAVPLAFLFLALTFRTIGYRRANRISVGDGNDQEMLRRMRVHANCAEYVPMGLIVMALAESLNTTPLILHLLGVALIAGRISHAYGMSQTPQSIPFRVAGMILTTTMIGIASLIAGYQALQRLL